jgi:hypothetical protein
MIQILFAMGLVLGSQTSFASNSGEADTYDESVDNAPPFSLNQNDPALSDLFNPANQKSGLCVPTTLANIVADQSVWRTPNFSHLQLTQTPEQGDYTQQVRYFAQQCHTDPVNGTIINNAASCIRQFYRNSGYQNGWAYLIGIEEFTDPQSVAFWHGPRPLTIDDIRYYVSNHVGVLMDIFWEQQQQNPTAFGPQGNNWVRKGGHTFMVAGYDYDFEWGPNQINLKVVNPEVTYASDDPSNHFDEITMTTAANTPGVSFPPGFTYVLSGKGFGNTSGTIRGFVRNIMVFLPDLSIAPNNSSHF